MPANILIVDDYADNRELLRLLLESAGHSVREAADGRAGIEMAQAEKPDLILIDLSMPKLDGWGMLGELRADERTRGVPCVAVTAFAGKEREQAIERGFNAYLLKPYRRTELMEMVDQLLTEAADRADRDLQV